MPKVNKIRIRNKGVRLVRVADLEDAPWNFRDHPQMQQDALSGAVDELGWYGHPDVYETADGNLRLIDGHLRKELLLKKYGVDAEIEVNVTDFDETEAKKATATKDPLAALAETNGPKLDALLREVETGSEALQAMLTTLATSGPIDLSDPPESVEENAEELEKIKGQRKKDNAGTADKNDTEKYLVVVYPSRAAKDEALSRLGLPADERYVSAAFVEIRSRGKVKPAKAKEGRPLKAANKKKSGAGG